MSSNSRTPGMEPHAAPYSWCILITLLTAAFTIPAGIAAPCTASGSITVNSESGLNDAISCFNQQMPPGDHIISVGQDITTATATPFTPITLSAMSQLTIQSSDSIQKTLTGFGSSQTSTAPLLTVSGSSQVNIRNIRLQAAPGPAVLVTGEALSVNLDTVSLFDNGIGLKLEHGRTTMTDSDATGNRREGIEIRNIGDEFLGTAAALELRSSSISFNGANGISAGTINGLMSHLIVNSDIANHFSGNGIEVTATNLTIEKSHIYNNAQDGIKTFTTDMTLIDSLIENNSGIGVSLDSEIIEGTRLTNNGIYNNSVGIQALNTPLRIDRSTIFSNDSTGVSLAGFGPINLSNSTVSQNDGDGIVASNGTDLTILSSTISRNSGDGVVGNPTVRVGSSILVGNDTSNAGFSDCADISPSMIVDLGANFDGDDTCPMFDSVSPSLISMDEDNGCDTHLPDSRCVLTQRLLAGNPAIDNGDCTGFQSQARVISFDQREVLRESKCDAGAYEESPKELTLVSSCLAGNGRVDLNIINTDTTTSVYRMEFEGLTTRERTVNFEDWGRISVTGRLPGSYSVAVERDGAVILNTSVSINCALTVPPVSKPEITIVNACRGNGPNRGQVFFEFVNPTAAARAYVIEFQNVPNRSTTAAPFGQAIRGTTGRPDGTYNYLVRVGSATADSGLIEVDCN